MEKFVIVKKNDNKMFWSGNDFLTDKPRFSKNIKSTTIHKDKEHAKNMITWNDLNECCMVIEWEE